MNTKMKRILILTLSVFFLAGCNDLEKKQQVEIIKTDSEQVTKIMSEEENYVLIDVREDYEYNSEHVVGAINIPLGSIDTIKEEYNTDTLVIVYCKSGNRSNKAANKLIELGYKNVYDLGGIDSITLDKVSEE